MAHIGPKCCCNTTPPEPCDLPTLACNTESGTIYWGHTGATDLWIIEDCFGAQVRIDLDHTQSSGEYSSVNSGCTYTLHATNECGEVSTSCGTPLPDPQPCECLDELNNRVSLPDVIVTLGGTSTPWPIFSAGEICVEVSKTCPDISGSYRIACGERLVFEFHEFICTTQPFPDPANWTDWYYWTRVILDYNSLLSVNGGNVSVTLASASFDVPYAGNPPDYYPGGGNIQRTIRLNRITEFCDSDFTAIYDPASGTGVINNRNACDIRPITASAAYA